MSSYCWPSRHSCCLKALTWGKRLAYSAQFSSTQAWYQYSCVDTVVPVLDLSILAATVCNVSSFASHHDHVVLVTHLNHIVAVQLPQAFKLC